MRRVVWEFLWKSQFSNSPHWKRRKKNITRPFRFPNRTIGQNRRADGAPSILLACSPVRYLSRENDQDVQVPAAGAWVPTAGFAL